jgi:hypothetical protein
MLKRLPFLLVSMALILAACAQAVQSDLPATPALLTPSPVTAVQAATREAVQPAATARVARCVAESRQSEPDPTMQALLPPIDQDDWAIGAEDAHVAFIEYGDFQ